MRTTILSQSNPRYDRKNGKAAMLQRVTRISVRGPVTYALSIALEWLDNVGEPGVETSWVSC